MAPPTPDDVALLEMTIRGRVVIPDNKREYETEIRRMHNHAFVDRKPLLFVLCHDAADVRDALKFVTKHGLPISVRSGGHSACGSSLKTGTVVIDVSRMREISYDPATELVTMQPGCLLSDVNVHLMRNGRMTPLGSVPPTGVGGLCLHGGIGHLTHRFGTAVDNIASLEILLADGTLREVGLDSTEQSDRDLFFAARGAAGSIGIVTRFSMRTYPMEMVTGGVWLMEDDSSYSATRVLLKKFRDRVQEENGGGGEGAQAHRGTFGLIIMMNFPPIDDIPAELHNAPCTLVTAAAWGTEPAAMDSLRELCDRDIVFGKPPAPMPFNVFNQILSGMFLNFPDLASYWKGSMTHALPDGKIDAMADIWSDHEPEFGMSYVGVEFHGGRAGTEYADGLNRGNDHCVSSLRDFTFSIPHLTYFPPNDAEWFDKGRALSRKIASVFEEDNIACYTNYQTTFEGEGEMKASELVLSNNRERLRAIKKKVDPNNIFSRVVVSTCIDGP